MRGRFALLGGAVLDRLRRRREGLRFDRVPDVRGEERGLRFDSDLRMILLGACFAVTLWLLALWVDVWFLTLRPPASAIYRWSAFFAGLVWWAMIARLGR